ncbi:amidohydrolase [Stenotrophomonas maltophilia]|uniref:amidohydrolase n=1 Tax=Stenotrophomonas maltophilia TaxID=40324 RepID=UPI001C60D800
MFSGPVSMIPHACHEEGLQVPEFWRCPVVKGRCSSQRIRRARGSLRGPQGRSRRMCIVCNPGAAAFLQARRDFLGSMIGLGVVAVAGTAAPMTAIAATPAPDLAGPADRIFHGGPIHTLGRKGKVQAIAVRQGRILATGSHEEVMLHRGRHTDVVDLRGRALLPGFIDPHMHSAMAMLSDWVDVTPFSTATLDEALSKIGAAARAVKPGEWIVAQGIDPSLMPGPAITMQALDGVAADNPVFVLESNGHIAYSNTKGFAAAGVTDATPDPDQGRYDRVHGILTGRMQESPAMKPFMAVMPMPGPERYAELIQQLFADATKAGCTSLHDAGIGTGGTTDLDVLHGVMANNPSVRYSGFLTSDLMDDWIKRGIKPGDGDDRFRLTGIKFWSDGSNQAQTGYQRQNYLGSDKRGALNYTEAQLIAGVQRAHDLGWQVGIHANGDAAIDTTLNVYQAVLAKTARTDHRHRIEHCSVLHPEQIARLADLQVSPSFLIGHVFYWGKAFRDNILGPQRAAFYDPCRSALNGGLRISLHSDFNVTTIEPLRYIDNAVNRRMRDGGEVLNPEECISVEQALRAVTIDAAWQCRVDDIVGSLEHGKYADMVILDRDPLKIDPARVLDLKVMETWLQGERRYAA